ncbi:nucleosome-remodeling factor subunit BPTF [Patella vulgata]|uniref:nucleosome-remodeling factor subunit BPTF n=1 Tax=Patella vulgata TaxID=6465 RepID=UPI0024A84247|nr:nucleosome-remodeling factor subunit BPTF [Patella vulgata]
MSTRSRRARGRPPKTPLSNNRTNFLRKPKAFSSGTDPNSRSSTPLSGSPSSYFSKGNGRSLRAKNRETGHRIRQYISHVGFLDEDDDRSVSSLADLEADRSSDITTGDCNPMDEDNSDEPYDDTIDDAVSDYSEDSFSTVSSSVSRRRLFQRRPRTPDVPDDVEIPELILPSSSKDLLIPNEHVMLAVSVYEVLRHFRIIMRISPFTFEDFLAALLSDEQCTLLAEIHICLIKALLREEDSNSTTFGPHDLKDSVNIALYFTDGMTWPESVRAYLDSDTHPEFRRVLPILENPDFPFVSYEDKLIVLNTLTNLFLATNKVREEITNEGNIRYDDHCRACHKLGDLLCCETCSAVYHLACVDPPLEEVPDDDWLCNVCRAHQVKGVTDCISEAEKSGLLCRQEPIGYDRHGRKYWFLTKRIIVESPDECWYYSTKAQLEELLFVIDCEEWEKDLALAIEEMKEDILKQMNITEELTNTARGNKKSFLELENSNIEKARTQRVLKKAQEESDRLAKLEEEKQKELEEKEKKLMDEQGEEMEVSSESITEVENMTSSAQSTTVTTASAILTNTSDSRDENQTVTTQITTTITNTTTETTETTIVTETSAVQSENTVVNDQSNNNNNSAATEAETKEDEKPKAKIVTLQSLLPNATKGAVLKLDDKRDGNQGKTVLFVNREGGKVTLSVAPQSKAGENTEKSENSLSVIQSTSTTTASLFESRKMLTRSKTGSLTPKQFTDSITSTTTSVKSAHKSSSDDVLVINKDGEITRISRNKTTSAVAVTQSEYFRLGNEGNYKMFQNQYSTNTLALNKHQHNEDRDKRRHLSHKFSMTPLSEFKWNGTVHGNRILTVSTLRLSITQLENNIPTPFLHPNWPIHRQNWQKAVHMCQNPQDFGLALAILEACIKPVVCNPVWSDHLGHCRLQRITGTDKEEIKKKEKEIRRRTEEEYEGRPAVWIKYPLGLKHQVWKMKGEEYRVTLSNGWQWLSAARTSQYVPQDSVGLRSVAQRIRQRKIKEAKAAKLNKIKNKKLESSNSATEIKSEEKMDVGSSKPSEQLDNLNVKMEVDTSNSSEQLDNSGAKIGDEVIKSSEQLDSSNVKMEVDNDKVISVTNTQESESKLVIKKEEIESSDTIDNKDVVMKVNNTINTDKEENKDNDVKEDLSFTEEDVKEVLKHLPPKVDVEVVDVSQSLLQRTYYQKYTKPYSRLDLLLEKRQKQEEWESKQRQALNQQIAWKIKMEKEKAAQATDKSAEKKLPQLFKMINGDVSEPSPFSEEGDNYVCYSLLCRTKGKSFCYSPLCRLKSKKATNKLSSLKIMKSLVKSEVVEDEDSQASLPPSMQEEEEIDVEGDKDGEKSNSSASSNLLNSIKSSPSASSDTVNISIPVPKTVDESSDKKTIIISGGNTESVSKTLVSLSSPTKPTPTPISSSAISLLASKGVNINQAQQALQAAIAKMSVEELASKLPPIRKTNAKFKLARFTKIGKRKGTKKASLPVCQKFQTSHKKKSIFVLERSELRLMSRKGGMREASGFNYNCKMNNVLWPYPCHRPWFKTAWRYRTQTIKTLAAAALQLRILWACIRWDDMSIKPPAGGTNTVSTETEITTTELLKRRDVGLFGLRSEFQVRKIVVPIGVTSQPKEKYTPQRSGLRERKRAESPKLTEPSVTEDWVPEETLELWEIKQFGEKLEKQRAAIQEKITVNTTQQTAAQIKERMEQTLKQQRLVMQQKRLQEANGKVVTSTPTTVTTSIVTLSSSAGLKTPIKTVTLSTPVSTSATGTPTTIRHLQPKTIIASSGIIGNTTIRPGMKLQLPSSTLTLRPASSGITLAPKPGTITTSTTGATTAKIIVPSQTQSPKVAIRPQVVAQGSPGQVQSVQIIQGPQGQLQVRGLLPGQQIIRLPDGRLQLISLSSSSSGTTSSTTSSPIQLRQGISVRPQGTVSTPNLTPSSTATQPTRVILPGGSATASLASGSLGVVSSNTVTLPAKPAGTSLLATNPSGTKTTILTPSVAKIISKPVTAVQQIVQPTVSSAQVVTPTATTLKSPLTSPLVVKTVTTPTGIKTFTSPTLIKAITSSTGIKTIVTSPQQVTKTILSPQGIRTALPTQVIKTNLASPVISTVATPVQQTTTPVVQKQDATPVVVTAAAASATAIPVSTGASLSAITIPGTPTTLLQQPRVPQTPSTSTPGTSALNPQKYAITPQVLQQVVRQALMQNQTPEIQSKLLAMQRQIQQQQDKPAVVPVVAPQPVTNLQNRDRQLQTQFQQQLHNKQQQLQQAQALESARKVKTLNPDEKEALNRLIIVGNTLKGILDKIEKEEKIEQKRQRKMESVEEKQKRITAAKQQGALLKQKEVLKKEILRKRSLMEKNLQQEIQLEIAGQVKKKKTSPTKITTPITSHPQHLPSASQIIRQPVAVPLAETDSNHQPSKKKKQKLISTGISKAFNPKERLYCICKTPYDDTKFYIGCDLCSNWFHGSCVGITEDQANIIDSYMCTDCRKQKENTSEELYCLCKTPYDESQFYVGCDRCQDWFHGGCVGISKTEADNLETYICPNCQKKEKDDPIAMKILTDKEYESLYRLLRSLKIHKMAWPFLRPVDPKTVPDYYQVIKDPMDLSIIETRVHSKSYQRLSDFVRDVTKIFDNCRYYNPTGTPFYQCAEVLETYFVQKLKSMHEKFS